MILFNLPASYFFPLTSASSLVITSPTYWTTKLPAFFEQCALKIFSRICSLFSKSSIETSVGDPDPGSSVFFTLDPRSGMGKKSRARIRDEHPGCSFWKLKISFLGKKCINSLLRIRVLSTWIRDLKSDQQSGINVPDPQNCLKPAAEQIS